MDDGRHPPICQDLEYWVTSSFCHKERITLEDEKINERWRHQGQTLWIYNNYQDIK